MNLHFHISFKHKSWKENLSIFGGINFVSQFTDGIFGKQIIETQYVSLCTIPVALSKRLLDGEQISVNDMVRTWRPNREDYRDFVRRKQRIRMDRRCLTAWIPCRYELALEFAFAKYSLGWNGKIETRRGKRVSVKTSFTIEKMRRERSIISL